MKSFHSLQKILIIIYKRVVINNKKSIYNSEKSNGSCQGKGSGGRVFVVVNGLECQQQTFNQYVDDARRRQHGKRTCDRSGDRKTFGTGFYTL